ncbi:hypothetical protein EII29_02540 [Leptotrichia sp. OH3620_COT-345]|uniref:hypothetical protein n=1 Tax=Leptotrichia sp. OH3620_COT-345 TaxID=2491048 RepID=UPI000F650335|nr:hypothetical protein [Leptotrichia sp. OH3620_COT-345]RRD40376.1 hypothetical protein EII29_02540 [Leptotrichia sp. OH3620_COT-345]
MFRKSWEKHLNLYLEAEGIEKVSADSLKKQRDTAIKNNELYKAEKLNREAINFNYRHSKDDIYSLNKKIKNDKLQEDQKLREEIDKIYFQKRFSKKYNEKKEKCDNKTFEEILTEKESIEKEIFKLSKNILDKNLETRALDILSKGEANKLKNEKRKLFKELKTVREDKKKNIKNKIRIIDKNINLLKEKHEKEIPDKKLELKGKYMNVLKFKIEEKKIMDKIFVEKLKEKEIKNLDEKNLYKAYIERTDLREEKFNEMTKLEKNKNEIKENLKSRNYKKVNNIKSENSNIRKNIASINRVRKKQINDVKAQEQIQKHGEFILLDYKYINFDEEYEVGLWR